MNTENSKKWIIAASLAVFASVSGESNVKSPEERRAKIEIAEKLLAKSVREVNPKIIAAIGDPFEVSDVPMPEVVVAKVEEKKLDAKELLPMLAKDVNATGIFSIAGEYYLMFQERKVKTGGLIPVMYKEKEYNLEIVSVLRNAFSLRFEDAELEIKLK